MPACFANTADSSTWAVGGKCLVITIVQSLHAKNRKNTFQVVFLFVLNNRFVQSDGFGKNCFLKTCCTFPAQSTIASIFFTSPYNSIPFVRSSSCLFAFVRHTARNWLSPKTPLFLLGKNTKGQNWPRTISNWSVFRSSIRPSAVFARFNACLRYNMFNCMLVKALGQNATRWDQACAAVVFWAWQLDFLWDWPCHRCIMSSLIHH